MNYKNHKENFLKQLSSNNVIVKLRSENRSVWKKVFLNLKYQPFFYNGEFLEYNCEYEKNSYEFIDISIIILNANKNAIGICPIFLKKNKKNSQYNISIYIPLFTKDLLYEHKYKIKFLEKIYSSIQDFAISIKIFNFTCFSLFNNEVNIENTVNYLFDKAKKVTFNREIYTNLKLSNEEIIKTINKNQFQQLSKRINKFDVKVFDKKHNTIWDNFKNLHYEISGRKTRSDKTWSLQYENLISNNAIFLYATDNNNKIISGAYFDISRDEANYSVSVSNDYAKKNYINSLLIFKAINVLKERKVLYLRLGRYDDQKSSDLKQININRFKLSFSNSILISQKLDFKISK